MQSTSTLVRGFLYFLCLTTLPTLHSRAEETPPPSQAATPETHIRLLAGRTAVGEHNPVPLGLHFLLEKGWKIYWRTAGDAGFPPTLSWEGSENLAAVAIHWPVPTRFSWAGLETTGYQDEVVLPLQITVNNPEEPARIRLQVDYLVCSDICIPGRANLGLDLPAGRGEISQDATTINRYERMVPGHHHGIRLLSAVHRTEEDGSASLDIEAESDTPFSKKIDLFVERHTQDQRDGIGTAQPKVHASEDRRRIRLQSRLTSPYEPGQELTLTLVDDDRGAETTRIPDHQPPSPATYGSGMAVMLGLAFLGGLILNLMPCVLPVLSLKILHLANHAGREQRDIRTGFAGSALGVVLTFAGLGAVLAALKAGGASFGWGIQFQNPLFLSLLALILVGFALNLWGLFEIRLPERLNQFAGTGTLSSRWAGPVANGVFATILATPCSAPFLGTAVGFALARGPLEIMLVFITLGLGMALPWIMVATVPGIGRILPRPGPWMIHLRRTMGVALLATAIWLVTIMASQQQGPARPEGAWIPFDEQDIRAQVAKGHVVLVDVTAQWCITCQVNKAVVLSREPVARLLEHPDVVGMRADWTSADPRISSYLAGFGRYGIPFNIVYGPASPEGIVLPEILTAGAILGAMQKAQGPRKRIIQENNRTGP